jgi:hypothetical protein
MGAAPEDAGSASTLQGSSDPQRVAELVNGIDFIRTAIRAIGPDRQRHFTGITHGSGIRCLGVRRVQGGRAIGASAADRQLTQR